MSEKCWDIFKVKILKVHWLYTTDRGGNTGLRSVLWPLFFKPEGDHNIAEVKTSKTKSICYGVDIFSNGNTF